MGLLLRLGYLAEVRSAPDFTAPLADAGFHDYWAKGLVTGDWTPPETTDPQIRTLPYLRPPGYPFLLAAIYRVFGVQNFVAVRLVQFAIGLLSCYLAYRPARNLFGPLAGLVAAALLACQWSFIYYEAELQEPFLLVVLLLAALLALERWTARPTIWRIAVAGALLGLAALVRPNILLAAPVIALWSIWVLRRRKTAWSKAMLQAGALAAGFIVAIAPTTIRNAAVSGDFVLISSNGAINFYIGNNERADGYTPRIPELKELAGDVAWSWFQYPQIKRGLENRLGRPLKNSDVDAYFKQRAWDYIRANPGPTAALTLKRLGLLLGPLEVGNNKEDHFERHASHFLPFLPGFPLMLAGGVLGVALVIRARREPAGDGDHERGVTPARFEMILLITLLFIIYLGSFVPFLAAERFRVPTAALLAIPAAFAIAELIEFSRARNTKSLAIWGIVGLALLGLAEIRWASYDPPLASYLMARGDAFVRQQNLEAAAHEYQHVIEVKPSYLYARDALAAVLERLNRKEQALAEYQARLRASPGDAPTLLHIGRLALQLGQLEVADQAFRDGLAHDPGSADLHYNFGLTLEAEKKNSEAEKEYSAALAANPRFVEAHVNLGGLLARRGDLTGAIAAYERALQIDPRRFEALYMLASAHHAQGNTDAAIADLQRAIQAHPNDPRAREALQRLEAERAGHKP